MPSVPRIQRAVPTGAVTHAAQPVPVVVTLQWMTTEPSRVEALAIAWTRSEVEVVWSWDGAMRSDWVPAGDVRRRRPD